MKSSKNILDFFKVQNVNLPCPACGILLPKLKLNIHLDSDCSSSLTSDHKSNNVNLKLHPGSSNTPAIGLKSKKLKANTQLSKRSKIGRLSLKQERINVKKDLDSKTNPTHDAKCFMETEIITLDDDSSSSKDTIVKTEKLVNEDLDTINTSSPKLNNSESTIVMNLEIKTSTDANCSDKKSTELICTNSNKVEISESNNQMNEKIVAFANCQVSDKIFVDSVHPASSDSKDSHSNKTKNVSNNQNLHSSDSPVNMFSESTKQLKIIDNLTEDADVIAVLNDAEESLEVDNNVFSQNSENHQQSKNYSPYYIANFKHILNAVLRDEYNKILFNDEDRTFVNAFETASDSAQKLFVRLFQRKYKWLRLNKINYPNITKEPGKVLEELVTLGLIDSGLNMIDLDTALDLLSLPEAKNVAKQFNFNSGKNKTDIIHMLLKHCKNHKSVFFCNGKNSVSNAMLKKVKQILGHCYRISLLPKRLFTRILMLFSLPTMSEDDDDAAGGQQQQLLTLLQVNKGEITFPDYKINRQTMIFIERDELIRYEEAKQIENDIINAVENKKFDVAKDLFVEAKEEFEDQLTRPFVERAASLPTFLKKYTSFHIYVRCMTQGVEILQRLRQYKEAVELLQRLLDQKVFCQDYRGRWWDRMALNLEQHLKQRQQALEAIKKGIKDKNVRVGYQHSLLTRALRILKTVDEKDELKNEILEAANVIEAPKVVIRGRLCPRSILGRRHVFISSSSALTDEDDVTVLGVEQLAIEHYKNEGFSEGIHGEGSTFHSLYGLLFWDIIYDGDIPDAFISPYQTHPLDLNHDSFFIRREKQILSHLETLRASPIEDLKEIVKSSWEAHFGQASIVVWDRFTDVDHFLGLVDCMGNNLLCGICERLARDFRFTRSGVPDLVVWNPESLQVKIVEVKGPGDKLSSKQILWLDYLLKLGAQAEVCLVEAVGAKKLRME